MQSLNDPIRLRPVWLYVPISKITLLYLEHHRFITDKPQRIVYLAYNPLEQFPRAFRLNYIEVYNTYALT